MGRLSWCLGLCLAGCAGSGPPPSLRMQLLQQGTSVKATAWMISEEDFAPPVGKVKHYRALPATQYLSAGGQKMTVLDPVQTSYFCALEGLDVKKPLRLDWRDTATNLGASCDVELFAGPCELCLTQNHGKLVLHWQPACEEVSVATPLTVARASGDHCELRDEPGPLKVTFTRRRQLADPLKLGGFAEVVYSQQAELKP